MRRPVLLLTRPQDSAARFAAALSDEARSRVDVMIAPLIRIEAVAPVPIIPNTGAVIFTSAQGVLHGPNGAGRVAYCVGAATTQAAEAKGWRAELAGNTAEDLIKALAIRAPAGPLLHLAGAHHRGDIAERLTHAGIETGRVTLYRQTLLPLGDAALRALQGTTIVPLFSPRTARQFLSSVRGPLPRCHLVAMSDSVNSGLQILEPAELIVLEKPTAEKMLKIVENLCLNATSS